MRMCHTVSEIWILSWNRLYFYNCISEKNGEFSFNDTAKRRANEAAEASNRRIQVLEKNFEKGEACALKLDVHVNQTATGLRSINDQSSQHQNRILQLEARLSYVQK